MMIHRRNISCWLLWGLVLLSVASNVAIWWIIALVVGQFR